MQKNEIGLKRKYKRSEFDDTSSEFNLLSLLYLLD